LFITQNQTIQDFLHFGSLESAAPCPTLAPNANVNRP
jgi:hypothetical protein